MDGCCGGCSDGYYPDNTTGNCKECDPSCKTCNDASCCASCELGFYLHNCDCVAPCPAGKFGYPVDGMCHDCD